jgi:hypothetical protein
MLLIAALCLVASGTAVAQKVGDGGDGVAEVRVDCDVTGYVAHAGTGGPIPDNEGDGVVFGPVETIDDDSIEDVILFVNMNHTWVGDLRLWLLYDHTCDGTGDIIGEVLCRPQLEGCEPIDCCGCGGNLDGWYAFDDDADSFEDLCPDDFEPGCYGPDLDSVGLEVFDYATSGGCFWLFVSDGAGQDTGEIIEWVVNVRYENTPVEGKSWGGVKALFR